jgi:hypothetical protein
MHVSNILSENISLFNPDQYFLIQINMTLNKKEFTVPHSGDCICISVNFD